MAGKITKTEVKLQLFKKRLKELNRLDKSDIFIAGRGFGKTMTAMAAMSEPFYLESQIRELEIAVAKIVANRERRKERRKERRLYKGERDSLHEWLKKNN